MTCLKVNRAPIASTPRMRPFKPGLALKAIADLLIEDEDDESDQGQERRHPHQENARGGQQANIRILRHG